MTTGVRKSGDFCWVNILTPEPSEARKFFATVFGWGYVEIPGMGHRIQVAGHDIGGLFDLNRPDTPPGLPPHIGVMMKVESADRTCERVAKLGGKAMPAFDIMDQGRMAPCFDPNGAQFDIWEPRKSPGADGDNMLHGAPSWFETMTTDVAAAEKFYCALFGWTATAMPMEGMSYTTFSLDGIAVAGMMGITPDMGKIPPHWGVYFTVKSADEAAATAGGLGATLFIPPRDIPGVGRFAGVISPQGVRFYVIEYRR